MAQMTWRTTDELLERVRRQAQERGRSLNDWVSTVLDAASDPTHAGSEGAQVRERLARAGLLDQTDEIRTSATDPVVVAAARVRAGQGTPLAELVAQGRG